MLLTISISPRLLQVLTSLLSPVNLNDPVLIHVLENMRGIHQNAHRSGRGHNEEDVQLQAIDHHGHVFPVFAGLKIGWIIIR